MKTLKLLGKTLFWILILGILLCPVSLELQEQSGPARFLTSLIPNRLFRAIG